MMSRNPSDHQDVDHGERQVVRVERLAGERYPRQPVAQRGEQAEPDGGTGDGGHGRLHRRDRGDLPRRGTDQAHRGEPLFPAGGGEPAGGTDEDQYREEQRAGHHGQDQVDGLGVVPDHAAVAPARRGGHQVVDPLGAWQVRDLFGGTADDDDQRVRRGQRGRADDPDLVAGVPVGELGGGRRAQQLGQRG